MYCFTLLTILIMLYILYSVEVCPKVCTFGPASSNFSILHFTLLVTTNPISFFVIKIFIIVHI